MALAPAITALVLGFQLLLMIFVSFGMAATSAL